MNGQDGPPPITNIVPDQPPSNDRTYQSASQYGSQPSTRAYYPHAGPQVIVAVSPKNVGLAVALSFFFGPLGLLYASVTGAIVMFFVNLAALFFTFGVGLLFTWPACVVWAIVASNNYNQRLAAGYTPPFGS